MKTGLFLLLIAKFKKRDKLREGLEIKRNQELNILEILSLVRLEKMLKLRDSLLGKNDLDGKPRV
jgi:hypothetical protein